MRLGLGCEDFILPIDHGWIVDVLEWAHCRVESGLENDRGDHWRDVMISWVMEIEKQDPRAI